MEHCTIYTFRAHFSDCPLLGVEEHITGKRRKEKKKEPWLMRREHSPESRHARIYVPLLVPSRRTSSTCLAQICLLFPPLSNSPAAGCSSTFYFFSILLLVEFVDHLAKLSCRSRAIAYLLFNIKRWKICVESKRREFSNKPST